MKMKPNKLLVFFLLLILIATTPLSALAEGENLISEVPVEATVPSEPDLMTNPEELEPNPNTAIGSDTSDIDTSDIDTADTDTTDADATTTDATDTNALESDTISPASMSVGIMPMSLITGPDVTVSSWTDLKDTVEQAEMDKLIHLDPSLAGTMTGLVTFTISHNYNITIDGGGATINSAATAKHFAINNSGTGTITLQNMVLEGNTTSGGVSSNASKVNISNITFQNSKGNIVTTTGTLHVSDSTFQNIVGRGISAGANGTNVTVDKTLFNKVNNTVGDHGSAIYSQGNLTVTYSSFVNSASTLDTGYIQGAIVAYQGSNRTVTISNSYFKDNKSSRYGGAIGLYQFSGTANIENCYFEGNGVSSKNANSDGGAIGLYNGSQSAPAVLNVKNSTFYKNTSQDDGSAIFVEGRNNTVTSNISNSTFYGNLTSKYIFSPADSGGAVQLSLFNTAHFTNNTFYGNSAANSTDLNGQGVAVGEHVDSANVDNRPTATFANNLMIGNGGGNTTARNVQIKNATDLGGNIGFDDGVALPPNITSNNILGTTPLLQANNSLLDPVGKPASGYTSVLTTVSILPNDGVTGQADQLITGSPALPLDARGYARSNTLSDSGAVEINYLKFDANGGAWSGLPTLAYDGSVFYADATASTGYFLVTVPGGEASISSTPVPTNGTKIFEGWFDQATGGNKVTGDVFATNQTLYAQWSDFIPAFYITYDGNNNTSGTAPVDSGKPYSSTEFPTILGPGDLEKTNYTFSGWNTSSDGSGTLYMEGDSITLTADTVLYAQWSLNQYSLTYDGNGNTGGAVPIDSNSPYNTDDLVLVLGKNSLEKTNYTFTGWNSTANGTGTSYNEGDSFNITEDTILYAQWTLKAPGDVDPNTPPKITPNAPPNTTPKVLPTLIPRTGDNNSAILLFAVALLSLLVLFIVFFRKWKRKNDNKEQ